MSRLHHTQRYLLHEVITRFLKKQVYFTKVKPKKKPNKPQPHDIPAEIWNS